MLAVDRALCDESEYRLTQYLMSNYDPSVRPARNSAEPLEVNFSLSLHHIIDVVRLARAGYGTHTLSVASIIRARTIRAIVFEAVTAP